MSRGSKKRQQRRREYMARLSNHENSTKFSREWQKRLESWVRDLKHYAPRFRDKDGAPMPTAASVVNKILKELASYGEQAITLEYDNTLKVLEHCYCKTIATVFDRNLYRPSINYQHLTERN